MVKSRSRSQRRRSQSQRRRSQKRSQRRRSQSQRRRTQRRQGGGSHLDGAPLRYSLAGDWSSRMSLGQGQDFFKYHADQHGGSAPYPAAVMGDALPSSMVGPSMSNGYYRAFSDVAGLKDPQPTPNIPLPGVSAAPSTAQGGGKHCGSRRRKGRKGQKKSQKRQQRQQQQRQQQRQQQQRQRQQQGGATLGYQSATAPGLLLPTQSMYNQAGLNPQYYLGTSTESADAIARDQIGPGGL